MNSGQFLTRFSPGGLSNDDKTDTSRELELSMGHSGKHFIEVNTIVF